MQLGQDSAPRKSHKKAKIVGGIVALFAIAGIFGSHDQPADTNSSKTPASQQASDIPIKTEKTSPTVTAQETAPATATTTPPPVTTPAPAPAPVSAAPKPAAVTPAPTPAPKTCGAGYYLNVDGNCIQSPTSSPSAGATGKCNDGTYTNAVHHQGACSHHGGVAYWF